MTTACAGDCHAPAVFGHRADCADGHRFLQDPWPAGSWAHVPPAARAAAAAANQATWDAPLQTETTT